LLWVYENGGIAEYTAGFSSVNKRLDHFGPSIIRRDLDFIILPLSFFLYIYDWRLNIKSIYLGAIWFTFIFFSLFVKEIGPYAPMIIPFNYLFLALIWPTDCNIKYNWNYKVSYIMVLAIFLVSSLLFVYRVVDIVIVNRNCRDVTLLEEKIFNKILPEHRVISSYDFYYAFKGRVKNYVEFTSYLDNQERFNWLPDFIVIRNEKILPLEELYPGITSRLKENYDIVGYYSCQPESFGLPFFFSRRNYNGTIVFERRE
jgi:hypothetical protein